MISFHTRAVLVKGSKVINCLCTGEQSLAERLVYLSGSVKNMENTKEKGEHLLLGMLGMQQGKHLFLCKINCLYGTVFLCRNIICF
jgi:hypothetical protein